MFMKKFANISDYLKIVKEKQSIMNIFVMDVEWNQLLEADLNALSVKISIIVKLVKKNIEMIINILFIRPEYSSH